MYITRWWWYCYLFDVVTSSYTALSVMYFFSTCKILNYTFLVLKKCSIQYFFFLLVLCKWNDIISCVTVCNEKGFVCLLLIVWYTCQRCTTLYKKCCFWVEHFPLLFTINKRSHCLPPLYFKGNKKIEKLVQTRSIKHI